MKTTVGHELSGGDIGTAGGPMPAMAIPTSAALAEASSWEDLKDILSNVFSSSEMGGGNAGGGGKGSPSNNQDPDDIPTKVNKMIRQSDKSLKGKGKTQINKETYRRKIEKDPKTLLEEEMRAKSTRGGSLRTQGDRTTSTSSGGEVIKRSSTDPAKPTEIEVNIEPPRQSTIRDAEWSEIVKNAPKGVSQMDILKAIGAIGATSGTAALFKMLGGDDESQEQVQSKPRLRLGRDENKSYTDTLRGLKRENR